MFNLPAAEVSPGCWNIIEWSKGYAILAGWRGGYLHGDSWRRSSGIVAVFPKDGGWVVETESGSLYILCEDTFGMTPLMTSIAVNYGMVVVGKLEEAKQILNDIKGE